MHPLKAYKHVHPDFADAFRLGQSIKLGTFDYYREMEGDRRDPLEGKVFNSIPYYSEGFDPPEAHEASRAKLRSIGFDIQGHNPGTQFIHCGEEVVLSPTYLFCCSLEPDDERRKLGELVFEISDLEAFGSELFRSSKVRLSRGILGPVEYVPRETNILLEDRIEPHPLKKSTDLAWEKEVRLCWPAGPTDAALPPWYIIDCPASAKYIKQV